MDSFQLIFFKELNQSEIGNNVIISPLSLYHIISLATNGARGETETEMLNTLFNKDIENMNLINKLIKDIVDKFETVECANHIFHLPEYAPKDSFLEKIKDYKAGIDSLENAEQVNKWCCDATHGKINQIIKEIPPCVMILINVIYFKGKWAENFDKALTRKRYFYNSKKEKYLVEFMQSENEYYYFEDEVIQAISLNYKKDNMEALIILPKNDNINDYIKNFNQKEYNNILECLNNEKVKLYFQNLN